MTHLYIYTYLLVGLWHFWASTVWVVICLHPTQILNWVLISQFDHRYTMQTENICWMSSSINNSHEWMYLFFCRVIVLKPKSTQQFKDTQRPHLALSGITSSHSKPANESSLKSMMGII